MGISLDSNSRKATEARAMAVQKAPEKSKPGPTKPNPVTAKEVDKAIEAVEPKTSYKRRSGKLADK